MRIQNECVQGASASAILTPNWMIFNALQNPLECLGTLQTEGLKHLEGFEIADDLENTHRLVNNFLSGRIEIGSGDFLEWTRIEGGTMEVTHEGFDHYSRLIQNSEGAEMQFMEELQAILLIAKDQMDFEIQLDDLLRKVLDETEMPEIKQSILLGMIAIAKHALEYWNAFFRTEFFQQDLDNKQNSPIWANLGGFESGFVETLIFNNEGGNGNPFANGLSVSILAGSALK